MSDIQQAARWLRLGHTVKRASIESYWVVPWEPRRFNYQVCCADGGNHDLDLFDLLADDWELAQ